MPVLNCSALIGFKSFSEDGDDPRDHVTSSASQISFVSEMHAKSRMG